MTDTSTLKDLYSRPLPNISSDVLSSSAITATNRTSLNPIFLKIIPRGPVANLRTISQTLSSLYGLLNLHEGWNSYATQPIRRETIDYAANWVPELLHNRTPVPAVVPTAQGGLQLEWHRNGVDLEIYIDSPDNIHFLAEDISTGKLTEGPLFGNELVLSGWMARVSD